MQISRIGKMPLKSFVLVPLALLAGCATNCPAPLPPVVQVQTTDTACDWTGPILVHQGDVLSDATARAILAHDQAGAKRCGWKPTSAPK